MSLRYQALASEARDAMAVAVSCWTLAGLFAQAVACALTFGQYEATAYALLVYEMKERAGNAREAEKQMLALSGGAETGGAETGARTAVRALAGRRRHAGLEHRIELYDQSLDKERNQLAEKAAAIIPDAQTHNILFPTPDQPTSEAGAILQALDEQGFKLAWVRGWRAALADPGLMPKPLNPQGKSKEEIAEKYGCGSSQVDNLRRCRRIITAFAGSEAAFLAAIEKV